MASDTELFKKIGDYLNTISKQYNFEVAKTAVSGRSSADKSGAREYRMQLINTGNDTSDKFKDVLPKLLADNSSVSSVKFNQLSPNSSKYSSVSFNIDKKRFDVVIAKGANKGENFEKKVVSDLAAYFSRSGINSDYAELINQLSMSNPEFSKNEIKSVKQRVGSTRKEGIPVERLGEVIGDIVLTDSTNKNWFISLKDVNGETFSSYDGAGTLFSSSGDLDASSKAASFLNAFGVNLNEIQAGFDVRNNKKKTRANIPVSKENSTIIKSIFQRAWGMNYFYVRKTSGSQWKVFWLGSEALEKLTSNIRVMNVKYPNKSSKQITIVCGNSYADYSVEIRNSKGGEYPNDIKFRVKKVSIK